MLVSLHLLIVAFGDKTSRLDGKGFMLTISMLFVIETRHPLHARLRVGGSKASCIYIYETLGWSAEERPWTRLGCEEVCVTTTTQSHLAPDNTGESLNR